MTESAPSLVSGMGVHDDWLAELRDRGASIEDRRVLHFGAPETERARLGEHPSLHALTDWSLIRAAGGDAQAYLQAQLSTDLALISPDRGQLSTYCTPQGRVFAGLVLWPDIAGYLLQVPFTIATAVCQRLQRYVLRATVELTEAGDEYALLGVGGPGASAPLEQIASPLPLQPWAIARGALACVMRLPGDLFQILVPRSHVWSVWERLAPAARPAGADAWAWRLIQAGVPVITAAIQAQFIPQMLNFDQLGAISYTKGCYPGQEVVARIHYRGEVKRHLLRMHTQAAPAAGQELFQQGAAGACGTVVNAAPAPQGGYDLLAVVQATAEQAEALQLAGGGAVYPCR